MAAPFNEAAKVVIDHWRNNGATGTGEEILEHVLSTVNVVEVRAALDDNPDDQVAQALMTVLVGYFRPTGDGLPLEYLPSVRELYDIIQFTRLPGEPLNYAQSNLTTLTRLQRLWIHLARKGKLPERGPTREQLITLVGVLSREGAVQLSSEQQLWARQAEVGELL